MADQKRVQIQTYVPAYQRQQWRDHADELDMSLSEFVRSMVQAGRRGFGTHAESGIPEGSSWTADPRGKALETHLIRRLRRDGSQDWDTLIDGITDDVEQELERLQEENQVRYDGRQDGLTLVSDE